MNDQLNKIAQCNVCSSNSNWIMSGQVLNKYSIDYFYCPSCEHLQTESPYWINEAYAEHPVSADTGMMLRNNIFSKVTSSIIFDHFGRSKKFLEYGGGYGVLTRLMRDMGFDFYWHDKYAKNIFAQGFEYNFKDEIELLVLFEVLEHLPNPIEEFGRLFEISPNILFSQTLMPTPPPALDDWWYYAPTGGQHIGFYTSKTLEFIAKKFKKNYVSFDVFHLFTDKYIDQESFTKSAKDYKENLINIESEMKSLTMQDMYTCIEILKNIDKR